MSTNKKISLISIIFALIVITIYGVTYAFSDVNDTGTIAFQDNGETDAEDFLVSEGDGSGSGNLYCVQKGTTMTEATYKAIEKVIILGNNATNSSGDKAEHESNGILAYILNNGGGYGAPHEYTTTQIALWRFFNTWVNDVGNYIGLNGWSESDNSDVDGTSESEDLYNEAVEYAKDIPSTEGPEDKTVESSLGLKLETINGSEYLKIGPFKWGFRGELSEMTVTAQDVTGSSTFDLNCKIQQNSEFVNVNNIESDTNFWIVINKDGTDFSNRKVSKITKIFVRQQKDDVVEATILFLEASSQQRLISVDTAPATIKAEKTYDYDIPVLGNLKVIKKDADDGVTKLEGVEFRIKNISSGINRWLKQNSDGKIEYVTDKDEATKFKTDSMGTIFIKDILAGAYRIYEVSNPIYGYDNDKIVKAIIQIGDGETTTIEYDEYTNNVYDTEHLKVKDRTTTQVTIFDEKQTGNLFIKKADNRDNNVLLPGVEFKMKNDNNEFIQLKVNGTWLNGNNKLIGKAVIQDMRTTSENDATIIVTDSKGEIGLVNLRIGKYSLIEIYNPNYGYIQKDEYGNVINKYFYNLEVKRQKSTETKSIGTNKWTTITIENLQVYVKVSGFVWEDLVEDMKTVSYNSLYKSGDADKADSLVQGISIKLMDRTTGKVVKNYDGVDCATYTDSNGSYLFEKVLLNQLYEQGRYYIEYEYDGVIYTTVAPLQGNDISKNSKVKEVLSGRSDGKDRATVNEAFSEITLDTARNSAGNTTYGLNYNTSEANTSKFVSAWGYNYTTNSNGNKLLQVQRSNNYVVAATSDQANYYLKQAFKPGSEEIKFNNMGIVKRERPDIYMKNDVDSVLVTVNGYQHTYLYSQRSSNVSDDRSTNIAVKFGNEYNSQKYTRAIYPSDIQFSKTLQQTDGKRLKVYVTYKISVVNQSSTLMMAANEIANYYDSRYTIVDSWKEDGTKVSWSTTSKYGKTYSTNEYIGAYTTGLAGEKIAANSMKTIYIKFQLNDAAVLNVLNEKQTLQNVTEVNAYSTYDANGRYAGIDVDSEPGNTIPGNVATYEDDTDRAPSMVLELANNPREVKGTIFEDNTLVGASLQTGSERKGNGIYDNNENTVKDAKVELLVATSNGTYVVAKTYEVENGTDAITKSSGQGEYTFKGIIPDNYLIRYTYGGVSKIITPSGEKVYTVQDYKGTIYSLSRNQNDPLWYKSAVDTRYQDAIDIYSEREAIDNELKITTNRSATTINEMHSLTPKFVINVEYESTYTASSGDQYTYEVKNVDFGIVERPRQAIDADKSVNYIKIVLSNGQTLIEGNPTTTKMQYLKYLPGKILIELDNELIQGATVTVGYTVSANNKSELDYISDGGYYYTYGVTNANSKVVTIKADKVIDYVDDELEFKADQNPNWNVVKVNDIQQLVSTELVDNNGVLTKYRTMITTDALAVDLKPTESAHQDLKLSALMSTSNELSYDNKVEILKTTKTGGNNIQTASGKPGNFNPTSTPAEADEAMAETVLITPPTGLNVNYIIYPLIGVIALVILGAGVYFIKKKAI